MMKTIVGVGVALASLGCFGVLTEQNKNEIQAGMQNLSMFQGLPLGGDPGDIARHWESLQQLVAISASDAAQRQEGCLKLSSACFYDLKVMNQTLVSPQLQAQFQDPDARRAFAVRYYHLLYFIFQYYRCMGWGWDAINADFATTGWPDAAEYRWQANAAKMREWLGAKPLDAAALQSAASAQPPSGSGVRSVREIEAAIRRYQNYRRDLERKANRASDDYSSYEDNERRRIANGGRVSSGRIGMGKLQTVHNYERLLRESDRVLEQLENELEAARVREEKAAESKPNAAAEPTADPASSGNSAAGSSTAVPSGKTNRFCTECGTKAAEGAKFCGSCGHKL